MDKLFLEIAHQVHDASGIKFPELYTWHRPIPTNHVYYPLDKIEIQLTENNCQRNGFDWIVSFGEVEYSGSGVPGNLENRMPDDIEWDECPQGCEWEFIEELISNALCGKYEEGLHTVDAPRLTGKGIEVVKIEMEDSVSNRYDIYSNGFHLATVIGLMYATIFVKALKSM
tara:strand:- start:4285 stop:4797 length:513 start_codon:yes stop_codon:yes gene_type:complete